MPAALFDLDGTLIIADFIVELSSHSKKHLSKVQILGYPFSHYVIHLEIMTHIFQQLRSKDVTIGIITASEYDKRKIIDLFNDIFNLNPAINEENCVFIGRNNYGHAYTDKGDKIFAAQQDGKLPKESEEITLIDNDHVHIASAQRRGYRTIIAGGFPDDPRMQVELNHSYLREIIEAFDLDISVPIEFAEDQPIRIDHSMLHQFKTSSGGIIPVSSIMYRQPITGASYHSLDAGEEAPCCTFACWCECIKCLASLVCGPRYY